MVRQVPDNFKFDIACAPLEKCLDIAFQGAPGGKATHWRVDADPLRLVLAWHDDGDFIPLPAALNAEGAQVFVKAWLGEAVYGPEPDQDGTNRKSWRVYNESCGHVGSSFYAFVAIEPCWAMYGK